MDSQEKQMRTLISIALLLCSIIIFYNAFFIPEVAMPSVIYIDKAKTGKKETIVQEDSQDDLETASEDYQKININTAGETEIAERIPGVGPALAKRIIEYRESNGSFQEISELKNVPGIGEKNFEKMADCISVE